MSLRMVISKVPLPLLWVAGDPLCHLPEWTGLTRLGCNGFRCTTIRLTRSIRMSKFRSQEIGSRSGSRRMGRRDCWARMGNPRVSDGVCLVSTLRLTVLTGCSPRRGDELGGHQGTYSRIRVRQSFLPPRHTYRIIPSDFIRYPSKMPFAQPIRPDPSSISTRITSTFRSSCSTLTNRMAPSSPQLLMRWHRVT